jgi:hypothetical protein
MAIDFAAADLTADQRKQMAPTAMPSGAYPIPTVAFLRKAIQSFGRCRPDQRDALVEHIRDRAKALGASDLLWVRNFLQAHTPTTKVGAS